MSRATWLYLLVAGCASSPVATPAQSPSTPPVAQPIPKTKPTPKLQQVWTQLRGSAERVGDRGLAVRYCCTAWGQARAQLRAPAPGKYAVRVAFKAACGSHHVVTLPGGQGLPLASVQAVTERCPIPVSDVAKFRLDVVGGLNCCGRTEIQSVALVAAPKRWSEERCAIFWRGIRAASMMGPVGTASFVNDVLADAAAP